MIVIHKKLRGIVPYRQIFWPTAAALKDLAENLPMTHYARAEFGDVDIDRGRCIVAHNLCLTLLIDLRQPLGSIYKNLIENARIRIHKAERLGSRVTVRRYSGGPDHDGLIPQFVELYNDFVRGKQKASGPVSAAQEYRYFPNADLVLAYLDGQPICGHLNLVDRENGIVRMHDSGNRRFDDPATARLAGILNVYLHWYEFERYREEGLATYDFGSLGQVEDSVGVNRFKMQFGGSIAREHNYILAGTPRAWRLASLLMSRVSKNWQGRMQMQKAGDKWRHMPLEQIRQTVLGAVANYERSLHAKRVAANNGPSHARRITAQVESSPVTDKDKNGKASQHA